MADIPEEGKVQIKQLAKETFDNEKGSFIASIKDSQDFKELQEKAKKGEEAQVKVKELEEVVGKQQTQLDAIEAAKKLQTENKSKGFSTIREALTDAFSKKEVKEQIAKCVANNGKQDAPIYVEIQKAAVDLTVANTIGAGSTQVTITQDTGIISPIRQRVEKYLAVVSVGTLATDRALWVEETDEQGTPIFLAEGSTATQLSVKYVEKTSEVRHIPVYGKVTTAMLADTPQLISYIENNLVKRVSIATETQLLTGNGTGENLNGLKTVATAFSAGALANAIATANEFDVLEALALQVETANGTPNAVFVHPSTTSRMKLIKDSTGVPLWKSYADNAGRINVSGMRVITTNAVTAGEFIGGDCSVANVLFREGMSVQIGLEGSDFINNKKTILVQQRLVQFVSANDAPVVVKGTFSTAKALLDPAVADS